MVGQAGTSVVVEGIPVTSLWENKRIFFLCLGVSFATFQYGFDTGIINGFQAMQGFLRVFGTYNAATERWGIETVFQQLITSLLQVGLIIASFGLGYFSRFFGRRAGFVAASLLSFLSITIQELVTVQWPIYIARLILGIANGMYVNLVVMYISETTPHYLRGSIVSCFQPMVSGGGLIGAIINNAWKQNLTKHSYQLQLVVLYIVPVWFMFYSFFMPESPRWLATRGDNEKARKALVRLRGNSVEPRFVEMELQAILESVRIENELKTGSSFMDIFRGPDLRRTLLCCGCAILHAASGINFLVGYATVFFQVAGSGNAFVNTTILKAIGVFGALCAPFAARYIGRRDILIYGFATTTISMGLVAILVTALPDSAAAGKAMIAFVCVYEYAYSISVGPLAWVSAGEMPSNRLRSQTFGFSMAIGFVFAWLTVFTTPYFVNPRSATFLGGKLAWIWFPSNLVTWIWLVFYLPETQNRTLEELDEMFHNKVPARHFSKYVVRGMDGVDQDRIIVGQDEKEQMEKSEEDRLENTNVLPKV